MDEALTCPHCGEEWYIRKHKTGLMRQCPTRRREADKRDAARHPERKARNRACRVRVGRYYVGMAPTVEQAAQLNQQTKERFG